MRGDRERAVLARPVHGVTGSGWRQVGSPSSVFDAICSASDRGSAGAAVAAHFLWNSPILEFFPAHPWEGAEWLLIPVATTVKGPPWLLLFVVIRLAHARERRWLLRRSSEFDEQASRPEAGGPGGPRRRVQARRELRRRAGGDRAAGLLSACRRSRSTSRWCVPAWPRTTIRRSFGSVRSAVPSATRSKRSSPARPPAVVGRDSSGPTDRVPRDGRRGGGWSKGCRR